MDIYDDKTLKVVTKYLFFVPIVTYISEKIVEEVQKFLSENSPISTDTMRKYVTYEKKAFGYGYRTTIYIDDRAMQKEQARHVYGRFNKFMSLDFSTRFPKSGGQTISYRLIQWLEETGAHGSLGNNPFEPIGMFKNVYAKLDRLIPQWMESFAKQKGIRIERG